ncbi:TlpA family protein disulfide reductase [Rhizomonospora bruguierae]|uniref:TlpA family protein disulfide reductase n=1 Tax=Rhizomonospora bruguierae TaxID=1581705 RepID=UPI001BD18F79|nr:redoxin domain-containing protein [Micromonospora sp. NBRC 107566]
MTGRRVASTWAKAASRRCPAVEGGEGDRRRRPVRRRLLWSVAAVLVLAGLGAMLAAGVRSTAGQDPTAPEAAAGPATVVRDDPAPPLAGRTLAGDGFDAATLRGRVVLVNVWASWCGPCRQELPALALAERRWGGQGLSVVGIDMRDNPESARGLLAEVGARGLPTIVDPQGTLAVAWGARGVPETFVVDRSGRVRLWVRGAVDAAWLQRWIPPLLADRSAP